MITWILASCVFIEERVDPEDPTCPYSEEVDEAFSISIGGCDDDRTYEGSCTSEGLERADVVAVEFTAPEAGFWTFDTEGSDFDTVLYVMEPCRTEELACNDDAVGLASELTIHLEEDQTVDLLVGSLNGCGNLILTGNRGSAPEICGENAPVVTAFTAVPVFGGPATLRFDFEATDSDGDLTEVDVGIFWDSDLDGSISGEVGTTYSLTVDGANGACSVSTMTGFVVPLIEEMNQFNEAFFPYNQRVEFQLVIGDTASRYFRQGHFGISEVVEVCTPRRSGAPGACEQPAPR